MEQKQLPKNIRQIGQAVKEPKIYIEDYVITFARKLAERNKDGKGIAVLLGKLPEKNGNEPVFVKGAVEISCLGESDSMTFDNETWSNIYEGVKNYFSDLEIVGWMLLHSGQEAGFQEKIKFIQETNFKGSGNILFVFDKEEKEENFYRYENSRFEKQEGYYIYYEKNEPMQNYMIDLFGNKSHESQGEDKVMEQVRELIANKEPVQEKKNVNFVYAASTALAAAVLVMGVTTLNNYDKMEDMEKTLNHISANMDGQEETELVVETITGSVEGKMPSAEKDAAEESASEPTEKGAEKEGTEKEGMDKEADEKAAAEETAGKETAEEEKTEEKETKETEAEEKTVMENETAAGKNNSEQEALTEEAMAEGDYYIVKKGDTLVSISGAIYGSDEYVDKIQVLNQIDNKDMIIEGQKLILP